MRTEQQIFNMLEPIPVYNTHSHFSTGLFSASRATLKEIWNKSYAGWTSSFPENVADIDDFISKRQLQSYSKYLLRGIEEVHGLAVSRDTTDALNEKILACYQTPNTLLTSLRQHSPYRLLLDDNYLEPGRSTLPETMFQKVYRVDLFLHGWCVGGRSVNGANVYELEQIPKCIDFDGFLEEMERIITVNKSRHNIRALKLGIAYERDIHFLPSDRDAARRAFHNPDATHTEILRFQDYLVFRLADIASKLQLPIQIHTGSGSMEGTRALNLFPLISNMPQTQFVLFHGGFPWTSDVLGLLHKFQNVHADLCWLPLISPTMAARFLMECIEVAGSSRISWGCDTRSIEESVGAYFALKDTIKAAFSALIDGGYMNYSEAEACLQQILFQNAVSLYGSF